MSTMHADRSLLFRMRALLGRSGKSDLLRLNDREVTEAARCLLQSAVWLRDVGDVETAIAFFAQSTTGNRQYLRGLFERAADLLDFATERDRGILYAGQYITYGDPSRAGDNRLGDQIRSRGDGAGGIGSTPGGRWLLRWDLPFLIGGEGEDAVWARATERFVDGLSGQVKVLLDLTEFDRALRTLEAHLLFNVPEITRIVYSLEAGGGRIMNADPALFEAGVVKHVRGKELVFRAAKK